LPYGHDKAKISEDFIKSLAGRVEGKLILVTAINPTPAGEGKTTTTVGLDEGLHAIGKNTTICIREASLGPCFGMKGVTNGFERLARFDLSRPVKSWLYWGEHIYFLEKY